MKVFIATDHRGFKLKEKLKAWLEEDGRDVQDLGAHEYIEDDDYPFYAERVGRAVRDDPESRGVLLCGSGAGGVAAVNKVRGIRASVGLSVEMVAAGRHDDDLNVLVIAADFTSLERAKELTQAFLGTQFDEHTERYRHRISQIREIEENERG